MSPIKSKVPVNVPGLSSFDKSFKNILTTKVGTITPICSRLIIPGSKGTLKVAISAALPPLASDTFMRCNLKTEAFFVPLRLLYGGFESFLTGNLLRDYSLTQDVIAQMPRVMLDYTQWNTVKTMLGPGTLADYLGVRIDTSQTPTSNTYVNIFKFLAYHRVYDDWFRNARVQTAVFRAPVALDQTSVVPLSALPFVALDQITDFVPANTFVDGVRLFDLRQRNWDDDYFTVATPSAQVGSAQAISVSSNQFTIAALRAGNSLQQFAERSNLASPRLQDYVKAHYGADLLSGVAQRSVLLGSASFPVYSKGVESSSSLSGSNNNPFLSVGARYGNAFASGLDFVCNFRADEPGYLMVMATLCPEANYASGIDKEMRAFITAGSQVDIPDPLLENVGNEPIFSTELSGSPGNSLGLVFGYVPKNTRHKTGLNEVHGLLRNGSPLASFVAQRDLMGVTPLSIGGNFLKIPTNALDNVTAVTADLSTYGCWIDSFIDLKVAEPLVESALPSLQDPAYEHGKTEYIDVNGFRL